MDFVRGNLALRDHREDGKRVFLFTYERQGYVKFVHELILFDVDLFETHDRKGDHRTAIKFFFKRAGAHLSVNTQDLIPVSNPSQELMAVQDSGQAEYFRRPNETERRGLVTSRVGQGAYRKSILHRWEYKCGVTDFQDLRLLIASHIIPWKDATDDQRLDVDNGILLSPTYDALFDNHLITFGPNGKIELSQSIDDAAFQQIGVTGKEVLNRPLTDGVRSYLEVHNGAYERKNKSTL